MNAASAEQEQAQWTPVCQKADIPPNSGLGALVGGEQVALFYSAQLEEIFAIGNYDPIGKANVLSRGIIGSIDDHVVVASPLYKQHFDLRTGECLESPEHSVPVYPVRIEDGQVLIQN